MICIDKDYNPHVASNLFDLVQILKSNEIKNCHGIWIGKNETDFFVLNPESYKNMLTPPKEHKLIDNAVEIVIYLKEKKFYKVAYRLSGKEGALESQDEVLYNYLSQSTLKVTYSVV